MIKHPISIQLKQSDGFQLNVDLGLSPSGITAIFGPSGCGKTTLLRCIAGLEKNSVSIIRIGNQLWQDSNQDFYLPTHKRKIAYIFQDARLFEHLSVRGNLEYAAKRCASKKPRISPQMIHRWLNLTPLLDRQVSGLSGGEKQRVAIARGLMVDPDLILMDEPLSSLDELSKQTILPYFETLHHKLNIPIIYVSHSIEEISRLSDYIVLMDSGNIVAQGDALSMLSEPSLPLAHLEQSSSVLKCKVDSHDVQYNLSMLSFSGGTLWVPKISAKEQTQIRVRIPARDISLCLSYPDDSSILNIIQCTIEAIEPTHADYQMIKLKSGTDYFMARITKKSCEKLKLTLNQKVYGQIKTIALNHTETNEPYGLQS